MSEFAPWWSSAKMTKSQVRKYVADIKQAQILAEEKMKVAKENWEFEKEEKELNKIEKELDDL